ncbi:MAG: DUF4010 domain-containing protein, partial [Campylobacterales bacterium]
MDETLLIKALLALALGFAIGLQREMHNLYKKHVDFGGARTFALLGLLGFLAGWINSISFLFAPVALMVVGLLMGVAYWIDVVKSGRSGLTTEIAALVTFGIGLLLYVTEMKYPVVLAIVTIFLLHSKASIEKIERFIEPHELNAAVLFLVMTLAVLPLLPNYSIDPWGVINPYLIWLMVVLVAGISFLGYILIRVFGAGRGTMLTGFLGGLASSTAVSISLSRQARDNPDLSRDLAAGIAVACSVMFARTYVEIALVNWELSKTIALPLMMALLSGYLFLFWLGRDGRAQAVEETLKLRNPFDLREALIFGLIFGAIIALITIAKTHVGDKGVYIVSFVSGITDVDA